MKLVLHPKSYGTDKPLDATCVEIVSYLEAHDFNVPGYDVTFSDYSLRPRSGIYYVESITHSASKTKLIFGAVQGPLVLDGKLYASYSDVAGLSRVERDGHVVWQNGTVTMTRLYDLDRFIRKHLLEPLWKYQSHLE